jgi:hypothetical protein
MLGRVILFATEKQYSYLGIFVVPALTTELNTLKPVLSARLMKLNFRFCDRSYSILQNKAKYGRMKKETYSSQERRAMREHILANALNPCV